MVVWIIFEGIMVYKYSYVCLFVCLFFLFALVLDADMKLKCSKYSLYDVHFTTSYIDRIEQTFQIKAACIGWH